MKTDKPLDVYYDPNLDHLQVDGIIYSGNFFRTFAHGDFPQPIEFVKREDGVITVRTLPKL